MFYYFYRFLLSSCVCQLLIKLMMMTREEVIKFWQLSASGSGSRNCCEGFCVALLDRKQKVSTNKWLFFYRSSVHTTAGTTNDGSLRDTSVLINELVRAMDEAAIVGNRPKPLPTPSATFTTAAAALRVNADASGHLSPPVWRLTSRLVRTKAPIFEQIPGSGIQYFVSILFHRQNLFKSRLHNATEQLKT